MDFFPLSFFSLSLSSIIDSHSTGTQLQRWLWSFPSPALFLLLVVVSYLIMLNIQDELSEPLKQNSTDTASTRLDASLVRVAY